MKFTPANQLILRKQNSTSNQDEFNDFKLHLRTSTIILRQQIKFLVE